MMVNSPGTGLDLELVLGAAQWLPTAAKGWVKFREQILLNSVYVGNNIQLNNLI